MNSGLFITFEGTEGSGKTTHIHRLTEDLTKAGHRVKKTREPGGTGIGDQIRTILLDVNNSQLFPTSELMLYAASRAQHVGQKIIPALKTGTIVVSDRFADASVAYQGYGRELDLTLIQQLNAMATNGLQPDLTFLLDLPIEIGLQRATASRHNLDRIERETLEFHHRVRTGYLAVAKAEPDRVQVVNATQSVDEIYRQIWSITQVHLPTKLTHTT